MANVDYPEDTRALLIRAAHDAGRTANDFGVLKWDSDMVHQEGTLPAEFSGRWVVMYCTGGDTHYAFSKTTGREVDRAAARGTTSGTVDKVGAVLADGLGNQVHRRLPFWEKSETCYFIRESTADNTTVYMELADPP